MKKRGIAPIVAVTIILALVVVLAVTITIYLRSTTQSKIALASEQIAKQNCPLLKFKTSACSCDSKINVIVDNEREFVILSDSLVQLSSDKETVEVPFPPLSEVKAGQGETFFVVVPSDLESVQEVQIVPIFEYQGQRIRCDDFASFKIETCSVELCELSSNL